MFGIVPGTGGGQCCSCVAFFLGEKVGDGPNTVLESTVSITELSEFYALTEFRGESSVSSSQPIICVQK